MESHFMKKVMAAEAAHTLEIVCLLEALDPHDAEGFSHLVAICLRAGLSRNELADEFQVSHTSISRWAAGKSVPTHFARRGIIGCLADAMRQLFDAEYRPLAWIAEVCEGIDEAQWATAEGPKQVARVLRERYGVVSAA